MLKGWDFLLTEIWALLALAALTGLIAGWIIWGRRPDASPHVAEVRRLRAELDRANAKTRDDKSAVAYVRPTKAATPIPAPKPVVRAIVAAPKSAPTAKPEGLTAARNGIPDDLTQVKGIGPKMEKLCNSLGFWHFDQIANWSPTEIAWVDNNLEGFKGRVTRDKWVAQAKVLAKL